MPARVHQPCWCPKRQEGGLVEVEVKSRAGRPGIALPDLLFALIIEHHKRQEQEREDAGTEWREGGWMFTQPSSAVRSGMSRSMITTSWSVLAHPGFRDCGI